MIRLLLIVLMSVTTRAFANEMAPDADGLLTTCGKETAPVAWSYCVHKTPGSQNRDVLYNFHGGNGDEGDWRGPNKVRKAWEAKGFDAPTVITVSFGPFWLLAHANGLPDSGLFEIFTDHIMPTLESKFVSQPMGVRRLWGFSMGGWNSSVLAILKPELFKSIAMTSPAILGVSPFASKSEIQAYADKNGIDLETLQSLMDIVKINLKDQAAWERSAPMALGPKLLGSKSPNFYITTGEADEVYGPGGREFAEMAIRAGAQVEWVKLPTDHLEFDSDAIAQFLMK